METPPLIVAFAAMVPLIGYIIYSDLRALRIPNWTVLAVLAVFVVCGLWGLPFGTFLWRLAAGLIALALGFGLYALAGGKIGGGDMKLTAALVPFVPGGQLGFVLLLYAVVSITALIVHRFVRATLRGRQTGWIALDQKVYFPAGLILGLTMLIYLGSEVASRL